jgi:hypothetical protein
MKKNILLVLVVILISISIYSCNDFTLKESDSNIKDESLIDFRDYYFNKPNMVYEYWIKDSKTGRINKSHYIMQIVQGDKHNFVMYEQWIDTNFNEVFTYMYHGDDTGLYLDSVVIIDPNKSGEESLIEPTITKNKVLAWKIEMDEKYPNLTKAYVISYYFYNVVNNQKVKVVCESGLSYYKIRNIEFNNNIGECVIFTDMPTYSYLNDKEEKISLFLSFFSLPLEGGSKGGGLL